MVHSQGPLIGQLVQIKPLSRFVLGQVYSWTACYTDFVLNCWHSLSENDLSSWSAQLGHSIAQWYKHPVDIRLVPDQSLTGNHWGSQKKCQHWYNC